jgi:hypothetical protein
MNKAFEIVDRQVKLIKFWRHNVEAAGVASSVLNTWIAPYRGMEETPLARQLATHIADSLDIAETYQLTNEMFRLVEAAAESMENDMLRRTDPFTKSGYMEIDGILWHKTVPLIQDMENPQIKDPGWMPLKAISWQEETTLMRDPQALSDQLRHGKSIDQTALHKSGLVITQWVDMHRLFNPQKGDPTYGVEWDRGDFLAGNIKDWVWRIPWLLADRTPWTYDHPWQSSGNDEWEPGRIMEDGSIQVDDTVAFIRRFMLSFFRIAHQFIEAEPVHRNVRRRRERESNRKLPHFGQINIISLRRTEQTGQIHEDDERQWKLTHRIMVRGFWRWQWHPTPSDPDHECEHCKAPKGYHQQIWINPFIKGPDGTPLVIKDRVFKVER